MPIDKAVSCSKISLEADLGRAKLKATVIYARHIRFGSRVTFPQYQAGFGEITKRGEMW